MQNTLNLHINPDILGHSWRDNDGRSRPGLDETHEGRIRGKPLTLGLIIGKATRMNIKRQIVGPTDIFAPEDFLEDGRRRQNEPFTIIRTTHHTERGFERMESSSDTFYAGIERLHIDKRNVASWFQTVVNQSHRTRLPSYDTLAVKRLILHETPINRSVATFLMRLLLSFFSFSTKSV